MVMSKNAELTEVERLMNELRDLGPYDGWSFTYEFPGYFCYSRQNLPFSVRFTPDWQADGTLPIEVHDDEGGYCEEHSTTLPLPREGRTGKQLFNLVRPTLDKLAKLPPPATQEAAMDQPCPHGDFRSCVVDDCAPLRSVHVPGVIVPPPALVACMWCGGDSARGQCPPCAALLDALHAAPAAGVTALVETTRLQFRAGHEVSDLHVSLTAEEIRALPAALEHVRVHMAHEHPWAVRDAALSAISKLVTAVRTAEEPSRDDKAEQLLRARIDQGGLRIIGVPEALPSAQEPGAVVLRVDVRVPATHIDEPYAEDRNTLVARILRAAQILRTLFEQGGLHIVGVPEAFTSAQEPGAIVLRFDVRVPAALIAEVH
jgi:hypothetical protein